MARNNIILENEDYTNRSVARLLFYCVFLCLVVILLAFTPIIETSWVVELRDFGTSALLLFIPYFLYYILKRTGPWFKYVAVSAIILVLIVLYSDFEINRFVFILWIIPMLVSIFYFDRQLTIIVSVTSMLSINVIDFVHGSTIFTPIKFEGGHNVIAIPNPNVPADTVFIDLCFITLILCAVALSVRARKLLTDLVTTEEQKSILQRLAILMQEANRVSATLVKSAKRLSEISSDSKTTSEKNTDYTQALATGAKSSLDLVHKSNPLYIQMADRVQEIARNATELDEIANALNEVTTEGSRAISNATDQMQKIASASRESKDIMDQLSIMSKRIVQIIKTISSIARQTNLLALNASIEAARAGEGGEGFRVVASSIRDLATQSAKATEDIRDLVTGIQSEIALAVKSIENETGLTESGLQIIHKAGEAFTEISATQEKLTGQATQIAAATQEIASGSNEVISSANEIEQYVQDGLNNAENIAAATVQQLAAAQELLAQAENVYQIAEKLNKLGRWGGDRKNARKSKTS